MIKRNTIVALLLILGLLSITLGVTVAFFNYTRTGSENTIAVGRIFFTSSQNGTINLSNVFPITENDLATDVNNHDSVTINIQGDTTYSQGIEYLITFDQVNNTVNDKKVPISFKISATNVGEDATGNYWNTRGENTSVYEIPEIEKILDGGYVLVGYIASGENGINGSIDVSAYIDADRIAITDTSDENSEWQQGRIVFSTTEWNSFMNTPISFKIKVEANEGIWVEEYSTEGSCFTTSVASIRLNENLTNEEIAICSNYLIPKIYSLSSDISTNTTKINSCVNILTDLWGEEVEGDTVNDGETYENFCKGTGTLWRNTFQKYLDEGWIEDGYLFELAENSILTFVYDETKRGILNNFCNGTGTNTGDENGQYFNESFFTDKQMNYLLSNNIASGILKIDDYDSSCGSDVVIPKNINGSTVTIIGERAFQEKGLTSVIIPNTITEIEQGDYRDAYGAFYNNQLTSVVIPNSVTTIGNCAFTYNQLTSVIISNSVTIIEMYAFYNNQLTSVVIPNSVTTIGNSAFSNNQLTNVTIRDGVTSIGAYAFYDNQLISVTIPDSITSIGSYAFQKNDIMTLTLGRGITFTSSCNNYLCSGLSDMAFDYTKISYFNKEIINSNLFFNLNTYNQFQGNLTLGNGVTSIENSAFQNNKLTGVVIPDSVITIGESAFSTNQLTSVVISNGVTTIGKSAFSFNKLTSAIIPNSVITIGAGAFYNNQLTSVVIPNSVTSVKASAFSNNQLTSVIIGNGVTSIGEGVFTKNDTSNSNLTSITINKSCSFIKEMDYYPWLDDLYPYKGDYSAGTTIYGSNNEVCDSW